MLPAWLRFNEQTRKHEVDPERADVIKSIFTMADEGFGQHKIAQRLNEQHVPTWGGRGNQRRAECWHRSYVKKLLTNSAVVGTFTPHQKNKQTKQRQPLEPIQNYFPAVIDRDLFERVASRTRAPAARGRNAGTEPASIFAGVLRCIHCSGLVTRVAKGEHVYLVCSGPTGREQKPVVILRCPMRTSRAQYGLTPKRLCATRRAASRRRRLRRKSRNWIWTVDIIAEQARRLADELIQEESGVVRLRLREKEAEWKAARERLRALRAQQEAMAKHYVRRRLDALKKALRRKPLNVKRHKQERSKRP